MRKILTIVLVVMAPAILGAQGFVFKQERDPMTDADQSGIMIEALAAGKSWRGNVNGPKDPRLCSCSIATWSASWTGRVGGVRVSKWCGWPSGFRQHPR